MSHHHLLFKNIHENRVSCRSKCCMQFLWLYSIFLFYVLWHLSQLFKVTKYFRLIAIMNLVYIIVFTLHIFNFWRGSKSANGGPYLLVYLDPRGSISTSRFGPGGPNLLVDMDRGSKSTGSKSTGTPSPQHISRNSLDTESNTHLIWNGNRSLGLFK
jgi:hypothetical protein